MSGLCERLQLGYRAVQQLVHKRVAHPLDGRLFLGREVHLLQGAGELVAPDLLRAIPELLYERDDVQRAEPAHELEDGRGDHGLPFLGSLAAVAGVALDDGLQIVYVVEEGPLQALDHRVYVARHRDVYEEQRLLSPGQRRGDRLVADHPIARARRAHDHVNTSQLFRERIEGDRAAADPLGEPAGALGGAVGDPDLLDAPAHEVLDEQLAHVARAEYQSATSPQRPEDPFRELYRDVGNRERAVPDPGLRAHLLADPERGVEQAVEHHAGALLLCRGPVRLADLAEDLTLPHDHRVEGRGYPVEVADGVRVGQPVRVLIERGPIHPAVLREELQDPRARALVLDDGVDLGPVAGREQDGLLGNTLLPEPPQEAPPGAGREGQALAHLHRRRPVAHPRNRDKHLFTSPSSSSAGGEPSTRAACSSSTMPAHSGPKRPSSSPLIPRASVGEAPPVETAICNLPLRTSEGTAKSPSE